MKVHKHLGGQAAAEKWKELCSKGKVPLSIAAGLDPYVYEGEAMIDSGAGDHIIG